MSTFRSRYFGKKAVLPTLHDKQRVIGPAFENGLGVEVVVSAIDTDQFGTFAGEVPRKLSQLETAIAKAKAAVELTGINLAVASEGTIGPDPVIPLLSSDLETLVFIDLENDITIHHSYRSSSIRAVSQEIKNLESLEGLLEKADFPNHGLIVRGSSIVKGIKDKNFLVSTVEKLINQGEVVRIETDLRASFCPSRMENIATCAKLLVEKINTECPECSTPGWGRIEPSYGIPCASCAGEVKQAIRADRDGCVRCDFVIEKARSNEVADPKLCENCNP